MEAADDAGEAEEVIETSESLNDGADAFENAGGVCDVYGDAEDALLWEVLCEVQDSGLRGSERGFEIPEAAA